MKKNKSNIKFKIPKQIYEQMLLDLRRDHAYAYERVGFLFTKTKLLTDNNIIIVATKYEPVVDENYVKDNSVGANINSISIRDAMQEILTTKSGCFHVHLHDFKGEPSPSFTDTKGLKGVVESFANISKEQPNGIIILSKNYFYIAVKFGKDKEFVKPDIISVVGYPMQLFYSHKNIKKRDKIYDRQSFLDKSSQSLLENVKVGIIGYGGGGSHIGQQLAHIGVKNIYVFDNDKVEDTNLNRLIGAWFIDVKKAVLKTAIANRTIKKILPTAKVNCINTRWQEKPELLQSCDIVFGSVDSFSEREQLEAECRRYLIPYIDIGMDVYKVEKEPYSMSGQVILSMPGYSCMKCFEYLTEDNLAKEAAKYGKAGGKPQVVWSNGILASTAIGIFVDLITGWTGKKDNLIYLLYDGNSGIISEHIHLKYCDKICKHYSITNIGVPNFIKL